MEKTLKALAVLIAVFFISFGSSAQLRGLIPPISSGVYYTASSTLPTSYGISYTPSLAGDQSLQSWWSPTASDRETCWLQLNFNSSKKVNYISILAGSHYPSFKNLGNLYNKNLRIKLAQLEFSDGSEEIISLEDLDQVQYVQFSSRYTKYIRIRPLRYYPSTKWNDPCISHFTSGNDQ